MRNLRNQNPHIWCGNFNYWYVKLPDGDHADGWFTIEEVRRYWLDNFTSHTVPCTSVRKFRRKLRQWSKNPRLAGLTFYLRGEKINIKGRV